MAELSHNCNPPRLAEGLLALLIGRSAEMLGDLSEEFLCRAAKDPRAAYYWYWQQVLRSLPYAVEHSVLLARLSCLVVCACLILLPVLIAFVAWLSNFDVFPAGVEQGMQRLVSGQIAGLLTESAIWGQFPEALRRTEDLWFLMHPPALIWSLLSVAAAYLYYRRKASSAVGFAVMALMLVFMPYVVGKLYIFWHAPPAKQVGPLLAFMLLHICYSVPPLAYMAVKGLRHSARYRHG